MILVVVHFVAFHFQNLTDRVIHRAAMAVKVVATHLLVRQEMTIGCDRQIALFQKAVKLLDTPLARIAHKIFHEQNHRLNREALLKHLDHANCQTAIELLALPEQGFTFDTDVALAVRQHDLLRFDCVFDSIPITSLDSVQDLLIGDVRSADGMRLVANYDNDICTLNDIRITHFLSFKFTRV